MMVQLFNKDSKNNELSEQEIQIVQKNSYSVRKSETVASEQLLKAVTTDFLNMGSS